VKTWVNCTLGINLGDEIKKKDNDKEWIVTKIDYPLCNGMIVYGMAKDGETMSIKFNSDEWVKSEINYMSAFMVLLSNIDRIEEEYVEFFKEN